MAGKLIRIAALAAARGLGYAAGTAAVSLLVYHWLGQL